MSATTLPRTTFPLYEHRIRSKLEDLISRVFSAPFAKTFSAPLGGAVAAAFSPSDIANLGLWLKADIGTYQDAAKAVPAASDGDAIYTWADQSTAGADAIQATSSKRPILKLAVLNGKQVLRWTGTTTNVTKLVAPMTVSSNALTVFCVSTKAAQGTALNKYSRIVAFWKNTDDPSNPADHATTHAWIALFYDYKITTPANIHTYRNGATIAHVHTPAYGTFCLHTSRLNGTGVTLRQNGVEVTGTTSATAMDSNEVNIGGSPLSTSIADSELNGDIAEVIIYKASLLDADIVKVETYLNSRWAVY